MSITAENLDRTMEFGRVIRVHEDGAVTDCGEVNVPETVYLILDDDGQSPDDDFQDVPEGWRPFTAGYTGQHGYKGPVMHTSEYIGGRLARDILSTPGYYVAVMVDGMYADGRDDDEDMRIGWAVFHREAL